MMAKLKSETPKVEAPAAGDLQTICVEARMEYRSLAWAIARGEVIYREQLAAVLLAASRSVNDLHADVKRLQQRLQAQRDLEAADELQPAVRAAAEEYRRACEALDEHGRAARRKEIELREVRDRTLVVYEQASGRAHNLQQTALAALKRTADPRIKHRRERLAAMGQRLKVMAGESTGSGAPVDRQVSRERCFARRDEVIEELARLGEVEKDATAGAWLTD